MKKRIVSAILAGSMLLSLAACNTNNSEQTESQTETETEATEPSETEP